MRTALKLATLSAALIASVASSGAQAQSVDVKVIGQIVPAACQVNLSAGTIVFDYANLAADTLNQTEYTKLGIKSAPLSIACDAGVKIGLRAVDNRASSKIANVPTDLPVGTLTDATAFGLGVSNGGVNVGSYGIQLEAVTVDGSGSPIISRQSDAGAWTVSADGVMTNAQGNAWSWGSTAGPATAQTVAANLKVQATLNRADALDLSGPVPLDGLATLELMYF